MQRAPVIWAVSDGRAGIENQALGLAEAIGRKLAIGVRRKRIAVTEPWRHLPRHLWGDPFAHLSASGHLLRGPYPDIWVAAGRLSVPYTIEVKRRAPEIFTVQTQDPRAPARLFDLIVPPRHDRLAGANVFPILGAPNRLTLEVLRDDAHALAPALERLPHPRVAVLIGGDSRAYRLSPARLAAILAALKGLTDAGAGLMVTASRRTGFENAARLSAALKDAPGAYVWDGGPVAGLKNPFFGFLGLADHILVTEDSTNMAAEAAATGKPVHLLALDGGSEKFDRFKRQFVDCGAARPFDGRLETWRYEPLRETERAADEVVRRWRARIAAS